MIKQRFDFVQLTADVVSAYVSNNHVQAADMPALLATVHAALTGRDARTALTAGAVGRLAAAQIRKSVQHDGIVSFLDGRTYKTLKRHLTANGLTPAAYCERYGLPADYPMVAPAYSARRSSLAKAIGLGVPGAQAGRAKATEPTPGRPRNAA